MVRKMLGISKGVNHWSDVPTPTKVVTVNTTSIIVRKANDERLAKDRTRVIFNFDFIMMRPKVTRPDNKMAIIKPAGIRIMVLLKTGVAVAKPETTRTSIKTARAVEQ